MGAAVGAYSGTSEAGSGSGCGTGIWGSDKLPRACLNREKRGAAAEGMAEEGAGDGSEGRTLAGGLLASGTN